MVLGSAGVVAAAVAGEGARESDPSAPFTLRLCSLFRRPGACPCSPFPWGAGARSHLSGPAGALPALTGLFSISSSAAALPTGRVCAQAAAALTRRLDPLSRPEPSPRIPLPGGRLPQRGRLRPLPGRLPTPAGAAACARRTSGRPARTEEPRLSVPGPASDAAPGPRPRRRAGAPRPAPAAPPGLGPSSRARVCLVGPGPRWPAHGGPRRRAAAARAARGSGSPSVAAPPRAPPPVSDPALHPAGGRAPPPSPRMRPAPAPAPPPAPPPPRPQPGRRPGTQDPDSRRAPRRPKSAGIQAALDLQLPACSAAPPRAGDTAPTSLKEPRRPLGRVGAERVRETAGRAGPPGA